MDFVRISRCFRNPIRTRISNGQRTRVFLREVEDFYEMNAVTVNEHPRPNGEEKLNLSRPVIRDHMPHSSQ